MKQSRTRSLRVCGSVLSSKNYDLFALRCSVCEAEFELWTLFICHLQQSHPKSVDVGYIAEENAAESTNRDDEDQPISYFHKHFFKEEENLVDCTSANVETELKIENPIVEDHNDCTMESGDEDELNSTWNNDEQTKNEGQKELKWFCFNLQEPSLKRASLAFLNLLKRQRVLWDSKHSGTPRERTKALKEIKENMKEIGWSATEGNLRRTASRILRQCQQAKQHLAKHEKLDKEAQLTYDLCTFLYEDPDNVEDHMEIASNSVENDNDEDANDSQSVKSCAVHLDFQNNEEADSDASSSWNSEVRQNAESNTYEKSGESDNDTDCSDVSCSESSQTATNSVTCVSSARKAKVCDNVLSIDCPAIINPILPFHQQKQHHKRILFNAEDKRISLELINLLRANPVLWDINHKYFNNLTDRKAILRSWIPIFKERHDIDFSYDDLSFNLTNLRRYYAKLRKRKHLDDASKLILDQCEFLPQEVRLRINCEYCGKLSTTAHTHRAHLYAAHKIGECPYKCLRCSKEFNNASQLDVHTRVRHTKQLKYACSQCDLRFVARCLLDSHMQVHLDIKNYICETCGKRFRRNDNLLKHETRIHLRQRNFACTMCPKAFYTKALLRDHTNVHLDIRNYKCPTCEKAFHSAHSLMRHKQIHAPVKKYACKLCDARFAQFVGLNTHMKHRHNAVSASVGKNSDKSID